MIYFNIGYIIDHIFQTSSQSGYITGQFDINYPGLSSHTKSRRNDIKQKIDIERNDYCQFTLCQYISQ